VLAATWSAGNSAASFARKRIQRQKASGHGGHSSTHRRRFRVIRIVLTEALSADPEIEVVGDRPARRHRPHQDCNSPFSRTLASSLWGDNGTGPDESSAKPQQDLRQKTRPEARDRRPSYDDGDAKRESSRVPSQPFSSLGPCESLAHSVCDFGNSLRDCCERINGNADYGIALRTKMRDSFQRCVRLLQFNGTTVYPGYRLPTL
jgi:hypothetical protein